MSGIYEDRGIRFEYPAGWEIDITEEESVTTVSAHADDGPAFFFFTLDLSRPEPQAIADQALIAMREEYPSLDATAIEETISGETAYGHDIEFFSLDVTNNCAIRCFRTETKTILYFSQWSDLNDESIAEVLRAVKTSLAEYPE